MKTRWLVASGALTAALICILPATAHAQYKNSQFTINAGAMFLFPSNNVNYYTESAEVDPLPAPAGQTAAAPTSTTGFLPDGSRWPHGFPYRLVNPMAQFSYSGKLSDDSHWWFTGGVVFALLGQITDPNIPGANGGSLGWIEPMLGPRYYFLTDDIRPFFEIGLRCGFIIGANASIPSKLQVIPGLYGQLGLEFIVARDLGLVISGRYSILGTSIFGFTVESSAEAMFGITFYF